MVLMMMCVCHCLIILRYKYNGISDANALQSVVTAASENTYK